MMLADSACSECLCGMVGWGDVMVGWDDVMVGWDDVMVGGCGMV